MRNLSCGGETDLDTTEAAAMARTAQFGSRSEKTVPEGYEE